MFVLSTISDTVKIEPREFGGDVTVALEDELNRKYANKVLQDVGLCVALFDLLKASEGKVRYGDGCIYHKVEFRLVVFRPFIGEIIVGRVKSCTEKHVRAEALHFWLPDPTEEQLLDPLSSDPDYRNYLDPDQPIRFRVEQEAFVDANPTIAPKAPVESTNEVGSEEDEREPPYSLICSISEQGLGLTSWWNAPEEGDEEEEDDDAAAAEEGEEEIEEEVEDEA
uniref:RNA polymerase III subunit Rpc25 domain-containing protein n=1 Tax=Bartheletia paradoxa TaxID=669517 RepID=A0A2D0XHS2_9BASI|nr:hypothetical protein SPAR04455 [Bartheletia paradoxa]